MEIKVEGISYPKYSDKDGRFHFALPDSFRGRKVTVSAQYQPTASADVPHSDIRSETVLIDDERNEVMLTRYPLEEIDPVTVATFPYPGGGRTGELYIGSSEGVTGSTVRHKTLFRQWIRNIFKKRPN